MAINWKICAIFSSHVPHANGLNDKRFHGVFISVSTQLSESKTMQSKCQIQRKQSALFHKIFILFNTKRKKFVYFLVFCFPFNLAQTYHFHFRSHSPSVGVLSLCCCANVNIHRGAVEHARNDMFLRTHKSTFTQSTLHTRAHTHTQAQSRTPLTLTNVHLLLARLHT